MRERDAREAGRERLEGRAGGVDAGDRLDADEVVFRVGCEHRDGVRAGSRQEKAGQKRERGRRTAPSRVNRDEHLGVDVRVGDGAERGELSLDRRRAGVERDGRLAVRAREGRLAVLQEEDDVSLAREPRARMELGGDAHRARRR